MRKAPIIQSIRDASNIDWCDNIVQNDQPNDHAIKQSIDQSLELFEDDGSLLDITPAEAANILNEQSINQSVNPNFICDFTPILPRTPHLSITDQSINWLNVWARFQHRASRPIKGHCCLIQDRLITAFDIYRAVIERGGYGAVMNRANGSFDVMKAAVMRAKLIKQSSDQTRIQSMPGGPPLVIKDLKPRTFLIDYYERFLYHFEHANQWKPGTAPLIDLTKPIALQFIDPLIKRAINPRAVDVARVQLLKSLWQPRFHKGVSEALKQSNKSSNTPVHLDVQLGFTGAAVLVTLLQSEQLADVTRASNELLEISMQVAQSTAVDDYDDDCSDIAMLFGAGLLTSLLAMLNTEDRHTDVRLPVNVRRFQAQFFQTRLAQMWPDFHTVALVIMNNLSQHRLCQVHMANDIKFINTISHLAFHEPSGVLPSQQEQTAEIAASVLLRLTSILDMKQLYRRDEWFEQHCALVISMVNDLLQHQSVDDCDVECAQFINGLTNLVLNSHSSSNIVEVFRLLPPAFFGSLVYLITPSCVIAAPKSSERAIDFLLFASLQDVCFAHRFFEAHSLDVLTDIVNEEGTSPEIEQRRRAAAASIQAIIARSLKPSWKHPWTGFEPIWSRLFLASARDEDVGLLIAPLLEEIRNIIINETTGKGAGG